MVSSQPQDSSVIARASRHIAGATFSQFPPEVAQKAKPHTLDTIAAMVSGSQLKPGQLAIEYATGLGGTPEAQVIGSHILTPPWPMASWPTRTRPTTFMSPAASTQGVVSSPPLPWPTWQDLTREA